MKFRNIFILSILILFLSGPLTILAPSSSATTVQGPIVRSIFNEMSGLLASRADQYGVEVDTSQAKLFQIGDSAAVLAPITKFDLRNLGLIGFLEVGNSFKLGNTELSAGSYRLEVGGDLRARQIQLNFRDEFGKVVATIPAQVEVDGFLPLLTSKVSAKGRFRNPLGGLRVIGPMISIDFLLTRRPPFVQNMQVCAGFVIPFGFGNVNLSFCL